MRVAGLDIERIATAALPPGGLAEARALCDLAYGVPVFETFDGGEHLLGRHCGLLVCHAMWITRWLQPADRAPLRTAYVELVATHPEHRNRGYATALMERLGGDIAGEDLGALSPATPGLYARLGWRTWRGPLFARTGGGLVPTPGEEVMVLPLRRTPPLDLDGPLSVEWRPGEIW